MSDQIATQLGGDPSGTTQEAEQSTKVPPDGTRRRGIPGYTYLTHLTKAAIEARVPVIAVILLGIIMLIPSQSAEALRVFAEDDIRQKAWLILVWSAYGVGLIIATGFALYVAFARYTKAQKVTIFCNAHRVVIGFAIAGPVLINGIAFRQSGAFPGIGLVAICASAVFMIGWSVVGWLWFNKVHVPAERQAPPEQTATTGLWFTFFALLVIGAVSAGCALLFQPAAPIYLTLSATLILSLLTAIHLLGRRLGIAAVAACFLWLITMDFFDWNDNHQVRTVAEGEHKPQEAAAALEAWLLARCIPSSTTQQLPKTCPAAEAKSAGGYPIVIVAAEGGGMRAAYFTDLVLQELRARSPEFEKHLFLIVGVSGGSVGAAAYAAALHAGLPAPDKAASSGDVTALEADFLSPAIGALLPGDFFARFWPFTDLSHLDRARSLEAALSNALKQPLGVSLHDIKFQDIYNPDPDHATPALMLMTTDVTTGHRMAVSHLTMPKPPSIEYDGSCRRRGDAADTGNAKDLTPRLWTFSEEMQHRDLPLDTAAILSARFPLVSPAGTLPSCSGPARRYVDGGYFENSGVTTVLDVIAAVREKVAAAKAKLIVLRIENSHALDRDDGSIVPTGAFSEVLSPVRAMLHTRQARAELAVETLARLQAAEQARCDRAKTIEDFIAANPNQRDVEHLRDTCLRLETAVIALRRPDPSQSSEPKSSEPSDKAYIPLGWWLSDKARGDMRRQLTDENNLPILSNISSQVGK